MPDQEEGVAAGVVGQRRPAVVERPAVALGLGQTEEIKTGGTTPTFGVKDIAAARAHLEGLGTRFDGDTHEIEGMVKLCTFYDPDGNPFMLAQSLDDRNR